MFILHRYLIKEILKHFGFVLVAAIGIYVSVDFFENIDKFMDAGLPISRIIEFLKLKLPLIIAQITPVGILLAVLITFGLMNKNNEIIALKSGGLSVYHFLRPILSLGILFSVFLFYLSEIVVPIFENSEIVGELDIDSHTISAFADEDEVFLKKICEITSRLF